MKRAIALAVLFAAGCAAALSLNVSRASAWSPTDLPPGFRVTHTVVGNYTGPGSIAPCADYYQFTAPVVSQPYCTDSPTFQQDFDAFVNANYTAPVTTTAPPVVSTTVTVTTPAPPATTATTDTTAAPAPAPAPQPSTVVVTTTATPVEQSLQAQIDALTAQLAALTDRVTRLEKAGDASWLAFEQAVQGGATIPDAAETARGTWLNVVNQLGAFAP